MRRQWAAHEIRRYYLVNISRGYENALRTLAHALRPIEVGTHSWTRSDSEVFFKINRSLGLHGKANSSSCFLATVRSRPRD